MARTIKEGRKNVSNLFSQTREKISQVTGIGDGREKETKTPRGALQSGRAQVPLGQRNTAPGGGRSKSTDRVMKSDSEDPYGS